MVVSKFRETQEGKWYLEVDRKPFLYNSLEAYLGEKESARKKRKKFIV